MALTLNPPQQGDFQDSANTTEPLLVLHLAAEGGSLKLWRYQQSPLELFVWEKNSVLLCDLLAEDLPAYGQSTNEMSTSELSTDYSAIEPVEQSLPVHSWELALHKLQQFPYWRHMHLLTLHPDYAKRLLLLWQQAALSSATPASDKLASGTAADDDWVSAP
jgi:hypothetical protein